MVQYFVEAESRPPIDALGIKRVQGIIGTLLYHVQATDNKLLVDLRDIGTQQASETKRTSTAITH